MTTPSGATGVGVYSPVMPPSGRRRGGGSKGGGRGRGNSSAQSNSIVGVTSKMTRPGVTKVKVPKGAKPGQILKTGAGGGGGNMKSGHVGTYAGKSSASRMGMTRTNKLSTNVGRGMSRRGK